MDGPTGLLAPGININVEVTFYMQLAFRRDYTWGAYFNEQWRSSDTALWQRGPTGQTINCDTPNIQCFGGTQESIVDSYQIKFPNGQGTNGVPLIPVGGPKICYSPLHKGVYGSWSWDPDTDGDCQDFGGYLDPATAGTGALRCPSEEFDPPYMKTVAPQDPNNPSAAVVATDTMEASVCTPWHELVGFYFGDDSYGFPDVDNDPNTQDGPILTVNGMDSDANSLLGNFIIGSTDPFTHTYAVAAPTNLAGYDESPVFVAFFTGGNRLSTLVNNADGRYRLETAIKFDFVNRTLLVNRSPRASMVPLLAVPYVAYVPNTRLGAHFQVMAYDQDYYKPELRDEVRFFLGNSREHGGTQANMVYTLNTDDLSANLYAGEYTWFQDYYYKYICARQVAEGATAGVRCADSRYLGTNADATYTQDNNYQAGSYYDVWDVTRNTPQPPPNLDIDPKTGVVTWETGSGPGLGYDQTQAYGSRTLGDGLVPGFYNLVVMVEERHNGDASMGYPDHIDDNGNDVNDATGTGFDATMCKDEYDGFAATNGRRPVYSWRDAIVQGTNVDAGYPFGGGEDICRASPAAPLPPSILQTMGTVKVPLDFLLYLYPTMHYCSMGCNMPTPQGGTSCGPWDTDCHSRDSDILATNTMHTFESINGWYGDTGSRSDGLEATSVSGGVEVTGACKICGGGGRYKEVQLSTSLIPLRTIDYRSVNGSAYCEVPNVDPTTLNGAPNQADFDANLNARWGAATGLVGNLAFDVLSYDPNNAAGVESGSTASFRYRQLYGSYPFDPQLFPETSYPYSPSGGRGMFPPSRTAGAQVGSTCSTSSTWLSFNEFDTGGVDQADFMFQGCLGTSPGYGVNRFGAVGVGANNPAGSNPFGGVENTPFLPVEGDNCYVNMPPRFVTFCSCDNVTETNPRYGNTPAMGCTHQMQVKTTEPYLTPDRANLATCCAASTQMTATASTNSGDLAKYPGMFAPAEVRGLKGSIVTFYLTARDDDQCTELVVDNLGLVDPSMRMEGYIRLDARTVSRKFVWYPRSIENPRDVNLENEVPPTNDLRDDQTLVCFYASDRYEYTALPFHCVQITLENPTSIVWCDQDKDRNPVAGRSELVGEENRIYKAYAGEEFKMPLCVMKREQATSGMNKNLNIWKIHWEDVGGASGHPSDPLNQVFNYPYDEINFPQSGKLSYDEDRCDHAYLTNDAAYLDPIGDRWYPSSGTDNSYLPASTDGSLKGSCQDPLYMTYGFTPSDFEECVYTVCFQGYDELSAPDGVPVDPTLNQVETTDVRCYKIEVYNNVLQFDGQAGALDVEISKNLLPQEGFAMSLWAYPECQTEATNMTLAYFGSVRDFNPTDACPDRRDTGNEVRNALRFWDMGDGMGRFFYYDIHVGAKMTEQTFCCGKWHHVGVSITEDHQAFLFVDGLTKEDQIKGSRDTVQFEVVDFNTTSRPDHRQDIDTALSVDGEVVTSSGYLALGYYPGQAFTGYLDEVRVWSRYLTKEEAKEQLHTRSLDYSADEQLRGHYLMGDGRLMTHGNNDFTNGYLPTVIAGQESCHSWTFNAADALANYAMDGRPQTLLKWPSLPSEPVILHKAVPVQIPCVLGMQHAVGPVDGQCVTDVYVWNAADGINPKCMFGGVEMPATWVTDDVIRCETPGHFTPRFVVVKASNDGMRFSDPTPVDKTVQHLFLESSLYVDGNGGGAEADSVCMDIPKRAVSFGGWTCAKCGPPTPDAPPPPSPPPSPPPPSPPPPSPPPPLAGGR